MTTKAQADAATALIGRQRLTKAARQDVLQALGLAPYWGADSNHKTGVATPALRTPDFDDTDPAPVQGRALPRVIRTGSFVGRRIA